MIKNIVVLSFLLIFFSSVLSAQNITPIDVVSINPVVRINHNVNSAEVSINFILNIKDTWHINANKPNDQSLTPTVIKIDSSSFYSVREITYPPAQMVKLQFSENELALYEQETEINVVLNVEKNFKKKSFTLAGKLQYQPCNDQTCLFPVNKSFKVEVKLK